VVGGRPGFKQYIFYGDDLSNHVQYVARHGPRGAYLPIASEAAQKGDDPRASAECREWIEDLNAGDYEYLVIGPDQRTQSLPPVEATWTAAAGGESLEERDNVSVFRLNGDLDPATCAVPRAVITTLQSQKPALALRRALRLRGGDKTGRAVGP
jgi:hypothetical protein